ncbi:MULTISPECIES: cold-shock protein [Parabacteroides]|uniref:Cold-shock DNA-binding protein family n=1 Tax=Parabacteroides chinchillae TaxID=871327 RepID=A0A8G2FAQ3_9BACT|nr:MULTISPECIES: cold shock domain-containing protein [Parabacteroides]SEF84292.1 cold-shock DNA-binding protein family [Parabacteroides chinchillae]
MAKRITSGKREREKLKQTKREEKLKKKEERLNKGSRSFEEMLAYVDENGLIHSTPQDIMPKEEIDASEILVSVPKQTEIEQPTEFNGLVEHFNSSKGYGFIIDTESKEKYFFHISAAPEEIAEGDKVIFEIERGTRGMNAVRISIIK